MFIINQQVVGWSNAMPMIIFHMWPILVGCPPKTKLWLISKTISKGKANIAKWFSLKAIS